jgi:hypothetical protein
MIPTTEVHSIDLATMTINREGLIMNPICKNSLIVSAAMFLAITCGVASNATADNGIRGLASCTTVHADHLYNICDYSIAVAWCEGDPCIGPYGHVKVLKPRHRTELTRASLPRQIVAGERLMTLIASRSEQATVAEVSRRNAQGNFVAGRVGAR